MSTIGEYNSYYANAYGWDPHTSCKSNLNAKGPADSCCGTYPNRFPFSSEDGGRGCCGDKTYNIGSLDCCSDTLNPVGTCSAATTTAPCACLNGGVCETTGISTTCTCPQGELKIFTQIALLVIDYYSSSE